jgi:23S rRNA (adenine2503-C2)-methyltransferase
MFALDTARFQKAAEEFRLPAYRLKQVREWVYSRFVNDFQQMSNLPQALREALAGKYQITSSQVVAERRTGDGTVKLLIQYPDGAKIEAVIMTYRDWSSACLSTQVGCAMGCVFCATGPLGFERNLTREEMAEEFWHCCRYAQDKSLKPIRNIVLMGIGEPLANFQNVVGLINVASDPELFKIGQRRITLSTVGLVDQINSLAQLNLSITLAVSLHGPSDKLRNQLMPITRKYPLQELLAACRNYTVITGRRVTFEYLMLDGVNDTDRHARELGKLLKGMNCLVNLIPFNEVPGTSLCSSRRINEFHRLAEQAGLNVTIRRSLGAEINAACGQLRRGTPGAKRGGIL